jgi:hypothetical protein
VNKAVFEVTYKTIQVVPRVEDLAIPLTRRRILSLEDALKKGNELILYPVLIERRRGRVGRWGLARA